MPLLRSPNGAVVDVPDEQIGNYVGYEPVEGADAARAIASPESPDRGVLGGVNAAATGLLSGATLGLSDYALKGLLNQGQFERPAAEREEHPIAGGIGQVAGAVIPAFANPETILGQSSSGALLRATPSGLLARETGLLAETGRIPQGVEGAGRILGAGGAARILAAGGVEGAIQNAGMYLSDTALGDRELSAEGLAASLGPGFAFGVAGGAAALGVEQGTIAARRLFSRAAGTDKAAEAAQSAWSTQYQSTLEANDAAADIARAKLAEARAAREQAQLAKQQAEAAKAEVKLRPMPADGTARAAISTEAPPVPQPVEVAGLLHDRAMAAMDPAKLAAWDAANGPRLAELMRSSAMSPITLEEAATATARPGAIDWDAIEQSAAMTPEQRALQDRALLSKAREEELAAAVAEHDAARADLDDILRRIDLPDVAPGLVEAPGFKVPPAEWGPPGMRGYDPGNVPAPGPPSVVEAATGDVTAVGKKKLAQGTPAEPAVLEQPSALEDLARMQREAGEPPTGLEGLVDAQRAAGQATKTGAAPELRPVELQPLPKEQRYGQAAGMDKPEQLPIRVPADLPGLDTGTFEDRFITAFNALDDLSGKHNNVVLSDIRAALPDVSREQFDAGLRELRKSKKYSLEAFEARQVMPHKDMLEGGLKENGQNLMLVQQRDTDGGRLLPSWAGKPEVAPAQTVAAEKPIERMSRDEIDKLQDELNAKFDKAKSGSREYVELSKQWDRAVERRAYIEKHGEGSFAAQEALAGPPGLSEPEFDAYSLDWRHALDPATERAFQGYTKNGAYSLINAPLRKGEGLAGVPADLREMVDQLDKGIAATRAPREMTLFRGVSGSRSTKQWGDLKVGDSIVDPGFGSTSIEQHVGKSYSKGMGVRPGVEIRIQVPEGFPAAPVPSETFGAEREVLLPRDVKYTVTSIEQRDGGKVINVTASHGAAPAAADTLTGQLGAMQSKLGSGIELGKLSRESPAAAEYASKKLAKREADAAYFRERAKSRIPDYDTLRKSAADHIETEVPARAIAERGYFEPPGAGTDAVRNAKAAQAIKEGQREPVSLMVTPSGKITVEGGRHRLAAAIEQDAPIKVRWSTGAEPSADMVARGAASSAPTGLEGLVGAQRLASKDVAADEFFSNLTRPKTRDAYVAQNIGRAMREEGSHAAALAKVEREWAEMSGHPISAKAVPDAVEDVAAVAQAVTKYEKSSARLVEALGPDAPPAAQEAAKAFRQAEEHSERKAMERTTRAIDDHAEAQAKQADVVVTRKTAPAPAAPEAPDWLDEARRLSGKVEFTPEQRALRDKQFREWEMNAAKGDVQRAGAKLAKAKVAETEAKIGARKAEDFAKQAREAAMKARPVAEAAPTSTLGAIATTIGVAGELGVPGIPKPHDIPIIGPLLGTYLKYRAIKAAAGRFVGRIPATGDARAAALVARTKDKIATAVDRTLGLAAEPAPEARAPLVATAAALGHRLIDDGEPDAPKNANAQQQAAVRIREIANAATQPGLVTALVRKELRGVTDPDLIAAAEQHLIDRFQKLNNVMPKAPPQNPYSKREWVPSPAAAHEVAQRLAVVHDPEAAFHDTTPAKAETLRDTWPRLLEFAQQRLIERVGDLKHPVPYENRLRNSLLFSVPLDDSMQPDHAAVLQSANAKSQPMQPPAAPGAPTPSIAGNSNLTALYQTASDRRAMR